MTTNDPKRNREYQAEFRERQKAAGKVEVRLWMHESLIERVKAYLKRQEAMRLLGAKK